MSKKSVIFGDTHLGLYSDSDAWLEIVFNFYKHIVKYCIKNKIKTLYHLGDFFNNRKSLNTKTQHVAHRIAKILELAKDLHTYIIVGNHDCYYKNQIQPNTLELFKQYNHITVVDKIIRVEDALLVPWGEVPNSTQDAKYCFGHFAINGFHMNDSYKCKAGLDKSIFKDFEKVLCGHFHTPSSNDNIIYLGAPYGQTFHDAGGTRGYHEFEDGKLTFIEYKDAPKFFKYHTNNPMAKEDVEGNIIQVIFDEDYGTTRNQEIVDNLLEFKPFLYSVNFTGIKTDDSEDISDAAIESKEQIAEQYIDNQMFASNINVATLKAMFRKMMREAGESKTNIKAGMGTKIECIDVGFKNFLSFGSQWQRIPLHNGVNFVTGIDKDKGKSNGAGKSSFLETIPFALFGKTARDIKQAQIINWKNKKNCQVVFRFKINDDVYEINRQLKPNRLEVFKNGTLIDQDAHKTDYQNMFEEIFGMDVKMFISLIHSNVNSSANILNMSKADKRKFLERMFGLVIYSDMNKICNDKLRDIEQKKYKIETDIAAADNQIDSCMKLKVKFREEINSKKSTLENVDEIKEELDKLKEDNPNIDKQLEDTYNEIKNKEKEFSSVRIEHEKYLVGVNSKIEQIEKEIRNIEALEEQKKENEKYQVKINAIIEKAGDIDKIFTDINEAERGLEQQNLLFNDANEAALVAYKKISDLEATLKVNEKGMALLADGKCPTCGADTKDPVANYKKDIASIKRKLTDNRKNYDIYKKDAEKHQEEAATFSNKIKVLHRTKDTLNSLKNNIKDINIIKNKQELLQEKDLIFQNKQDEIGTFSAKQKTHIDEINALKNKASQLGIDQNKIREAEKKYDLAVSKAEEVKKHIKSLNLMIKEQEEKAKKIAEGIQESGDNKKKLNTLADYINAIKVILKDENIKQFTIKQIMPFLNKQTNSYLSEVNYGFYVNIDKWLDVEIKGPGIRNASYGSLSGGEKRGIDIAMQLSLLDIARTQSGLFPDLLVFDELLDSSIDSRGINELMKIVKVKQKEFGGKIFIISHRDEIDGELVDYQYNVVKENSFSKVYV